MSCLVLFFFLGQNIKIALSPKLSIRWIRNLRIKHRPETTTCTWATITLNQIQHGWWPPSWKSLWRHNSAADNPIVMKFGTLMENYMPMIVKRSKSNRKVEFQYGGRLFSETAVEIIISAMVWGTSSKFGKPIALDLLKYKTWANQKSEVDLQRYGRHLVKPIDFITPIGDHSICIQFGRPMYANDKKRSKSTPKVKLQYGGRLFSEAGSSNISAVDWDIWSKFGMPIALDNFKSRASSKQNPEVDLQPTAAIL